MAMVKTQQNNFIELKANMKAQNEQNVIIEDAESAEDDIAQLIPKRTGSHLSQTQKNNLQKVKNNMRLIEHPNVVGPNEERKEMVTSTTMNQLSE